MMENNDSSFNQLNRLQQITKGLDERGLILSLAAFADEALADLLSAFMKPGEAATSLLKGFNAPLGTFSTRIKASVALDLITLRQHENLNRLRRMRNVFAHSWEPVSFGEQPLSSHISALHFSPLVNEFPENSIEKVRVIISALLIEIRSATHRIERNGWAVRSLGNHLIPGLPSDTPDHIANCETSISDIDKELPIAKADRRLFLIAQHERWTALLTIIRP